MPHVSSWGPVLAFEDQDGDVHAFPGGTAGPLVPGVPLESLSGRGLGVTLGGAAPASPGGCGSGWGCPHPHSSPGALSGVGGSGEQAAAALMPLPSPPHCGQKVAYTTVLQEWLRLACRSDAHPELVRRHLVTFRAMSARLLDYVVNIADSNGNTALHYSVSHANFPVVRQLLDSGEWGGGGWAGCSPVLDGLMAEVQLSS